VKFDLGVRLDLEKEPKTYRKESFEVFDFGLKLFKLLTGENRYDDIENFELMLRYSRKISHHEVTQINPKVPSVMSEVIYRMTENKQRATVFSELMVLLRNI